MEEVQIKKEMSLPVRHTNRVFLKGNLSKRQLETQEVKGREIDLGVRITYSQWSHRLI